MKKFILAMMACLSFSACADSAKPIRFATEATYPPFEFIDGNNTIQGFDIDLANALCKEMNTKCEFTHQAYDSLIPSLKFRRFDAIIAAIDVTPERLNQVAFTDVYYDNAAIFIARKEQSASIATLKGKRVGVQNGTTHQKYLLQKHSEITVVAYDSNQNAILDLQNKRLDAIFGDTAVVTEWLKNDNTLENVGEKITDADFFGTGFAIAVNKNNTDLLDKLNKALTKINEDGTYQTLYSKWF